MFCKLFFNESNGLSGAQCDRFDLCVMLTVNLEICFGPHYKHISNRSFGRKPLSARTFLDNQAVYKILLRHETRIPGVAPFFFLMGI